MTEIKTLIFCKDYLKLKKSTRSCFLNKTNEFYNGVEVLIIPFSDKINIINAEDGYFIEIHDTEIIKVGNINKFSKYRKDYCRITIPQSWNCEYVLIVKHPFSGGSFSGTDIMTYIETDEYFIKKCKPHSHSGTVYIPKEIGEKFKKVFVFPFIEGETEIFENDGNVVIRSFCDEFVTKNLKPTTNRYSCGLSKRWVGMYVLFIKSPSR